jgi:hypothetical protein
LAAHHPDLAAGNPYRRVTLRQGLVVILLSAAYLLLSHWLVGYKTDQLVLTIIANICYFAHPVTRKFIVNFSIFILYWALYDWMKAFPNYRYHSVDIGGLYNTEKSIFGITVDGVVRTPNEYFDLNRSTALTVLAGCFYLTWVPLPLLFALYLLFTRERRYQLFAWSFLIVNTVGFVIYYLHPAAPPWYIKEHGFTFISSVKSNEAALAVFDQVTGTQIFHSLYSKGSNVFAAMPSLHSAYPLIVFYYAWRYRFKYIKWFFAVVMMGIWFSAVYTYHHYTLDVLAGIATGIFGIFITQKILKKLGVVDDVSEALHLTTARRANKN